MADFSIQEILANCEFFKDFEETEIESISNICRLESFGAGDCLFRQGDFGGNLYIIADGQVFLERATDLGGRKGSVVVSMLGKGRVCGCWSSLLNDAHNLMSSAVCQKETRVVVVEGDKLREMMQRDKAFGFCVLEKLSFLLRDRIQGAYGAMEKI